MRAPRQRRQFEVRASYLGGSIERSASVLAETPEQAAALAVWRGYLPVRFEDAGAGPIPVFWDPHTQAKSHWPRPVASFAVSDDHACIWLALEGATPSTLLVEAKAL
jgi:hypothetical protein